MPRTVSATITAGIAGPVTDPWYLVELGFSTTLRLSTHGLIDWDGKTWSPGGVMVESVTTNEARIVLQNADNSASALVLAHSLADVPVSIYACYDGDAELVFSGTLDSAPLIGQRVMLTAIGHAGAALYPTERISAPVFNHLTPAGTTIRWGTNSIELEAESIWP